RRRHPRGPALQEDDRAPPGRPALGVHRRRRRLRRPARPGSRRGAGRRAGRQDRMRRGLRCGAHPGRRRGGRGEDQGAAGGAGRPPPERRRPLAPAPTPETLREYLTARPVDRMVLIPPTDEWALAVARLPAELAARFPSSLAPLDSLEALID